MLYKYEYKIGGYNRFGLHVSRIYTYDNLTSEAEGYKLAYGRFIAQGYTFNYCQTTDLNWKGRLGIW